MVFTRLARFLRTYPWATLVVVGYLVLGGVFSVANPIHEATDEVRHYRYVRYIADYGQLPVQSGAEGNAQAHHPPLYYATAALVSFWVHPSDPLYEPLHNPQWGFRNWEVGTDNKNLYLHGPDEAWPYRDASLAAHLARWVTLLWGAAAVALTIAIARTLLPEYPAVSLVAGALIAFNPMFLYLGAAVNNDVPAGTVAAAITLASLHTVRDGITRRGTIWLGALFGVGMLVKFNVLAMLGVIEVALLLAAFRGNESHPWQSLLRANGWIGGISAILSGWWYVRNTILYGEPTGFLRLTEIWGFRNPEAGVHLAGTELLYAWTSLWARFGYGQIPVPTIYYTITAVLCGAGLAGAVIFLVRSRWVEGNERQLTAKTQSSQRKSGNHRDTEETDGLRPFQGKLGGMVLVLAASVVVNFAVLYAYITVSPAGAMGRFFFPGLPALVTLVAAGLIVLWPGKVQIATAGLISVGMLIYAATTLTGYLIPAYSLPAQAASPADPLDIVIGENARVLAYHVSPSEARPGDEVDVTVTWEILKATDVPYAVFIHLSNPDGALIAQRDTYTGGGNYPSQWWQPGHIFTETYRVFLSDTTYSPDQAIVEIGLYNPDAGRLPVQGGSSAEAGTLIVGEVMIPEDSNVEYPNQMFINWENRFALVGYKIDRRVLKPGQRMKIRLYWQALDPSGDQDYKVFLHIVEGWDQRWAGRDGNPVSPDESTRNWIVGDVYKDTREIKLPDDIPPGTYTIELGWFSDSDGHRLNIVAEDGHIVDNWLPLNTIQVVAP